MRRQPNGMLLFGWTYLNTLFVSNSGTLLNLNTTVGETAGMSVLLNNNVVGL